MAKGRKKRSVQKGDIVKVILLIAAFWLLTSTVYSMIIGALTKTMTIGKAVTENVYSPYGMMVYDAYGIAAPLNGEGASITAEGIRVRRNAAVFKVTAASGSAMQGRSEKIMYAPLSGIVTYHIDGYENVRTGDDVQALDLAKIYEDERQNDYQWQLAREGVTFAKIINNLDDIFMYLDCEQNSYTETFAEGDKIRIRFPELSYSTICRVVEIESYQKAANKSSRLMVKVDLGTAEQNVFSRRVWQVELPYDVAHVVEIPKAAIIYQDNEAGVFELDKGFAYWRSIEISEEKTDTVIVENLAEGAQIVTTPQYVKEGEFVKAKGAK